MITSISDLLPILTPDVPGCPENRLLQVLKQSMRETVRFVETWTIKLDPISLVANESDYNLDAGEDIEIVRILSATLNGGAIDPKTYSLVGLDASPWAALRFNDANTPKTSQTDALVVTVVAVPDVNADTLPPFELTKCYPAIVALAASKLLAEAGRRWFDPNRSVFMRRQYWRYISDLCYQRDTGRLGVSPVAVGESFISER